MYFPSGENDPQADPGLLSAHEYRPPIAPEESNPQPIRLLHQTKVFGCSGRGKFKFSRSVVPE